MDRARGLYVIVDPEHCAGRPALEIAKAALCGGAKILQLRSKRLCDRERLALARAMRAMCREHDAAFVLNDRPDLAVLSEADGLHLGQDDLAIADARRIVGAMRIGVSTHDLAQARRAIDAGADLIGFGPVFGTRTKENPDPIVGLESLRAICRETRVPVVAIGGIDVSRLNAVVEAGAAMWAVISAVGSATDPEATTRALVR